MKLHLLKGKDEKVRSVQTDLKFEWRIPLYLNNNQQKFRHIERSNRYLMHQNIKISKLIQQEKFQDAEKQMEGMLRTSISFKTGAFNRYLNGGYYNISVVKAKRIGRKFLKIAKTLPTEAKIKRVYIPKKNGKLRPLGVPSIPDRILNSVGAKFLSTCHEQTAKCQHQHAYRTGKGIGTAGKEVIELSKNNHNIYEYDLKSFFNTIKPEPLYSELVTRFNFKRLAEYVQLTNRGTVPEIAVLNTEEEFKRSSEVEAIRKIYKKVGNNDLPNTIIKSGLPQGMPGSGILAMIVLDNVGMEKLNAVMYSDDGIIFTEEKQDIESELEMNEDLKIAGIKIAKEKSGGVKNDTIKFLGSELNFKTRILTSGGIKVNADKISDEELKKVVGKTYSGVNKKDGKWEIDKSSWLASIMQGEGEGNRIIGGIKIAARYIMKILNGKDTRKQGRIYKLKTYQYNRASTQACEGLLKGGLKNNKISNLKINGKKKRFQALSKTVGPLVPTLAPTMKIIEDRKVTILHHVPEHLIVE